MKFEYHLDDAHIILVQCEHVIFFPLTFMPHLLTDNVGMAFRRETFLLLLLEYTLQ
jgi:hypothetical protein